MMGLRRYGRAAELFSASLRYHGEHHVTWYNVGICHSFEKRLEESLKVGEMLRI